MMSGRWVKVAGLVTAVALVAAGCGSSTEAATPSTGQAGAGGVQIVASTNVWGDIAAQIGGDRVTVTAIVVDAAADPHSFEVGAQDQLAVSKAQLLITNGGHYDDFMTQLISAAGTQAPVVEAVTAAAHDEAATTETDDHADETASDDHAADDHADETASDDHAGHDHGHGEANEHLWFDLHAVGHVAEAIEAELATLDPAGAAVYEANLAAFLAELETLEEQAHTLSDTAKGRGVAVTEPLPLLLLDEIGLVNRTPAEFSNAIEADTDVPATVLAETLALFTGHEVDLLVYNEQTASPQTEQVKSAAQEAGIPVVGMTETLPDGTSYTSWMSANLDALAAALAG